MNFDVGPLMVQCAFDILTFNESPLGEHDGNR